MKSKSVWLALAMAVAAPLAFHSGTDGAAVAQAQCNTFEETNQEVCGDFYEYWQRNGGLAQQGFPISTLMREVSPTDGKIYEVQYFERAVFEAHPENKPPHNVLLSLLGTHTYARKYPQGAPGQEPNTSPGSVLFRETGKRVGGRFLDYWQRNDGLAQQGFPISDEFMEKSDLDGKTYRVQYFERAVFEYHPENAGKPSEVLLSQLGTARASARRGPQVTFTTSDGVKLRGSLFGTGKIAVILSHMCAPPGRWNWLDYARHISERGYMALAYDYRGMGESDTGPIFNRLEYDLRAAIEFVMSRGAERVILAGGSCGGASSLYMSIKEPQKVAGLIVLASSRYGTGLSVTTEDLVALRVPKLFISTELDPVTFSTLDLYDQTPEPKEKHIYPGSAHGTDLFFTEHRDDLTARMTAFIEKHVPAR
jgi:uncharacterized protein